MFEAPEPLRSRDLIPLRCNVRLTAVNRSLAEARRAQESGQLRAALPTATIVVVGQSG